MVQKVKLLAGEMASYFLAKGMPFGLWLRRNVEFFNRLAHQSKTDQFDSGVKVRWPETVPFLMNNLC